MLNDQQLAKLANKLQVPSVISGILDGDEALTDDVHYALHDVISDLSPDEALLCIALAAKKISTLSDTDTQTLPIMRLECDRIIEDYGPLWLAHANENSEKREEETLDSLDMIAEDLEGLTELLEFCSDFVFFEHKTVSELCTILQIQARAHAVIVEEFSRAVAAQSRRAIQDLAKANVAAKASLESEIAALAPANADNVITFPGRRGD